VLSQRDKIQFTCERLSDETVREIASLIEQREGKALNVDTPRERLESLFLRIVEAAHAQQIETAGTAPVGEIAGFLGAEKAGEAVLESLVRVEPEAPQAEAPAEPEPAPTAAGEDVLAGLTGATAETREEEPAASGTEEGEAPPAPKEVRPPAMEKKPIAPPREVDRAVLDELIDKSEADDKDEE
jgi:hypothetical protein